MPKLTFWKALLAFVGAFATAMGAGLLDNGFQLQDLWTALGIALGASGVTWFGPANAVKP